MTRLVVEHRYQGTDNEILTVVTVFEPGINKEQIKKMNRFTKKINTLIPCGNRYDWKRSG
ncbi:hypothetical protein [Heyndrickxia sporothermodurans]|uniref:hypothetical protein n=1 Tax=Heyndrickxia sporothermodurans TaxID=46224 RepID=UPI0035DFAD09